jgi:hypothetical protein
MVNIVLLKYMRGDIFSISCKKEENPKCKKPKKVLKIFPSRL